MEPFSSTNSKVIHILSFSICLMFGCIYLPDNITVSRYFLFDTVTYHRPHAMRPCSVCIANIPLPSSPFFTLPLTLFCTLHNHCTLHIESHTTTTLKDCHQFSTMSTHGIYVLRSPRDLEIASTTQIKTRYKYNELILSLTLLPFSLPPSPQALRHSE